jgi:DNA (cytosine-5)-methyltransferase 1
VDILTTGFPCTDVSLAGERAGLREGNRSGVWTHCARAIGVLRPSLVIIENVRGILNAGADSPVEQCPWCVGGEEQPALRALGAVLGDLADLGFDAEWLGLPASDTGAPHERWREFIIAWPATENPDGATGREWRPAASGQTESGGAWPDAGGRGGVPAAPAGIGRLTLLPTPAARDWKSGASNLMDHNSRPLNEYAVNMLASVRTPDAQWIAGDGTDYGPAIRRWEQVLGRPAPCPTEPGGRGNRRLSARFSEWMMGLPAGWVTDVPGLSRNDQLHAIGNGVIPQQGEAAIRLLLERAPEATRTLLAHAGAGMAA